MYKNIPQVAKTTLTDVSKTFMYYFRQEIYTKFVTDLPMPFQFLGLNTSKDTKNKMLYYNKSISIQLNVTWTNICKQIEYVSIVTSLPHHYI